MDDPSGGGRIRAAAARNAASRAVTPSRCASMPRIRRASSDRKRASSPICPYRKMRASRPGSRRERKYRRFTIRCSPRSSYTARTAPMHWRSSIRRSRTTRVWGVETNLAYLAEAARLDEFRSGRTTTATLENSRLPSALDRSLDARRAIEPAGLAGTARLLACRRSAIGADGRPLASPGQSHRRQSRNARPCSNARLTGPTLAFRYRCHDRARRRA